MQVQNYPLSVLRNISDLIVGSGQADACIKVDSVISV